MQNVSAINKVVYDYLFYKSYVLAQKSKNFKGIPVLGGIWFFMIGFMFNIFTVLLVIDGSIGTGLMENKIFTAGKYVFAALLVISMYLYFKNGQRWKRIVSKYEQKESKKKGIHQIIVLVGYYVLSFALGTVASMYQNNKCFSNG